MYVFHKIKHAYNIIMKFIYKLLIIMNIQYIIILIAVDTSYLLYIGLILQIGIDALKLSVGFTDRNSVGNPHFIKCV